MLIYKVVAQYLRGNEAQIAEFKTQTEAKNFILEKLQEDLGMKLQVKYHIVEFGDVIQTFEPLDEMTALASGDNASSPGTGSSISNPFSTQLKPAGAIKRDERANDNDSEEENFK